MGRLGRIMRRRQSVRALVIGLAVVLLLGTVAGGAWALSTSKAKRLDVAATYTVSLTPTETQDDSGDVSWTVGQATIVASCGAGYNDPANPGRISMGWGGGVTNNGPGPIGVVAPHGDEDIEGNGDTVIWLEAGQSIDAGPGPGQSVNETNYPGPVAGVQTFAIVDEGGISASGTWAYSARVNDADGTAHCVFSLQMKG